MRVVLVGCAVVLLLSATTSMAHIDTQQEVSYWAGTKSDGLTFVLELHKSGWVRFISETGTIGKGKWKRASATIEMRLNGKFLTLSATIEDDLMKGVATTKQGDKWTWSATRQPGVIQTAAPVYPALAAAAMVGAAVLVEVEIDSQGGVASIRSVKGHPLLHEVSSAAARRYKFHPAGSGVIRTARLTFSFSRLPVKKQEDIAPLILSPYLIVLRYRPPTIHRSYARRGTELRW